MKLVRSGIPKLAEEAGVDEEFRPVRDYGELLKLLDEKLDEELTEWREENDIRELADLLDVVMTSAAVRGVSPDEMWDLVDEKRERCGSLAYGVVWLGTERRDWSKA